ncbi:unnamed protein product [Caenorhabditis brenneri]
MYTLILLLFLSPPISNATGNIEENLKNVLESYPKRGELFVKVHGLYVLNNTELYDGNGFKNVNMNPNFKMELCDIRIENNPKLDMEKYCNDELLDTLLGIRTKGNLKECGCEGDRITSESLSSYENCTELNYGLRLFNFTETEKLSFLSNIKQINGYIDIRNSSIRDFSFLKNLKIWKVKSWEKVILNLQNNLEMRRMPFGFFGKIIESDSEGLMMGNFENLHPDFCLSIEELLLVLKYELSFQKLHAKLCDDYGNVGRNVICRFESMEELPNNCKIILGDLVIENGDEQLMMKVVYLELIIGSLIVRNTELNTLGSLGEKMKIIQLNDSTPVIQIVGNKQLRDSTIESLANIITRERRVAIIQDNHPIISSPDGCELVTEFYLLPYRKYRTRLDFTGGDCGERVEIKTSKARSYAILNIALPKFSVGPITLEISTDSPSFCITTQEITTFLKTSDIDLDYVYGKICKPERFDEKMCEEPETGCLEIVGDVKIGEDSDPEIMRTVEIIYGGLTIMDSNVTSLEFLENLEHVAQLKEKPSILIANNPNLINFTFPKLKKVLWMSARGIIFMNNSNSMYSENSDYCYDLRKSSGLSYIAPMINGLTCGKTF